MFARLGRLIGYFSDTTARTLVAVFASFLAFAGIELLIHVVLRRLSLSSSNLVFLDASIVGAVGASLCWLQLRGNRERRRRVRLELARISELNHEVRNALQVISHSHFDADNERREMVLQSVDRIDATLKRLFPVLGGQLRINEDRAAQKKGWGLKQ